MGISVESTEGLFSPLFPGRIGYGFVWSRYIFKENYLNGRVRVVVGGFFGLVFFNTLFCSVLWRFIGEMFDDKRMDFKSYHYTHTTSTSPQMLGREKNP